LSYIIVIWYFKEICNLISKRYPKFAEKYQNTTNYTSHNEQDDLAHLCAENISCKIIKEIENIKVFGIMCNGKNPTYKLPVNLIKFWKGVKIILTRWLDVNWIIVGFVFFKPILTGTFLLLIFQTVFN